MIHTTGPPESTYGGVNVYQSSVSPSGSYYTCSGIITPLRMNRWTYGCSKFSVGGSVVYDVPGYV